MKNYLIDLDGTIYRGDVPVEFAEEFVEYLNKNKRKYLFVTNCPYNSPESIMHKLRNMGIKTAAERILNSGEACADYLKRFHDGKRVYVIGSESFNKQIVDAKMIVVDDFPDIVAVGYDKEFNYRKLDLASRFIRKGAVFVATNTDDVIPSGSDFVPHTGAILSAVAKASGREPLIIGKPEKFMLETAVRKLFCAKEDCVVIGDRIDTDIAFAVKNKIPGYLVLTGITDRKQIESSSIRPDRIFNNLKEIEQFEK